MEEVKQKRRLPDWAVKLLIWVGPSLALLLLHMWGFGLVLSDGTWITFCLVPIFGLILTRLVFLFRSRRSAGGKVWRTSIWVIVLVPLWFFALFFPRELHRCTRIRPRERFEEAYCKVFPEDRLLPLELGEPEAVECHSYMWSLLIYESHSRTLLCRYGEADYPEAKAALEARYRFRTEPLDTEWAAPGKEVKQIEPYTSIGDDSFRFLLTGGKLRHILLDVLGRMQPVDINAVHTQSLQTRGDRCTALARLIFDTRKMLGGESDLFSPDTFSQQTFGGSLTVHLGGIPKGKTAVIRGVECLRKLFVAVGLTEYDSAAAGASPPRPCADHAGVHRFFVEKIFHLIQPPILFIYQKKHLLAFLRQMLFDRFDVCFNKKLLAKRNAVGINIDGTYEKKNSLDQTPDSAERT